jgi:hypothetical protein
MIIDGKELPPIKMPSPDGSVQQVLKPEPTRSPGLAPGSHPSPA